MGLFCLIPGLILWLSNAGWFESQEKVGVILTIIGAVLIAIQVAWAAFVLAAAKRQISRF
jgi:hypothetical protein